MYKFPLRTVLNHRKYLEENLQKEFGILKRLLVDERKKLTDIRKSRKNCSKELRQRQQQSLTISESLIYVQFLEQLAKNLDKQKVKVIEAEQDVEKKREDLVEAVKNRKALEKLKEKGLETYRNNLLKQEQSLMNEMASVRFQRNRELGKSRE